MFKATRLPATRSSAVGGGGGAAKNVVCEFMPARVPRDKRTARTGHHSTRFEILVLFESCIVQNTRLFWIHSVPDYGEALRD